MNRRKSLQKFLPPLTLLVILCGVYLRTLAPGLTWANQGSDGGDLIAAAATTGVAHPTGYPLYLILARLVQFLPVGSLAFRTNFLSAFMAVLGALLTYLFVTRSHARTWASGLTAALAFGLAPLVWSQAVITEVYTLQAALLIALLSVNTLPAPSDPSHQTSLDLWHGLLLGLALCNQVTTLLLLPVLLAAGATRQIHEDGISTRSRLRFDRVSLLRQLAGLAVGLSLYLLLPLRALSNPPINWGNAITPERFWWLVSGQLYQGYYLQFNLTGFWEWMQGVARFLIEQFGIPGLMLGSIGLVVYGARTRSFLLTGWVATASLVFSLVYRPSDSDVYLIPLVLCVAIWMGLGMQGMIDQFSQRPILIWTLVLLAVAYFSYRTMFYWPEVDASHDGRAEAFGRQVMTSAPQNAILFAEGDESVFTLWYFHYALGERPDVVVVAEDLLHFDWYQETLRSTYPSLKVPGPFPWPETIALSNPARPICYVRALEPPELRCSQPGP